MLNIFSAKLTSHRFETSQLSLLTFMSSFKKKKKERIQTGCVSNPCLTEQGQHSWFVESLFLFCQSGWSVRAAALSFRPGAARDCWRLICIFQITIHAINWRLLSDYVPSLCLMQCTFPRAKKNVMIDLVSTETMTCQNERAPAVFYARLRAPRGAFGVGVKDNTI